MLTTICQLYDNNPNPAVSSMPRDSAQELASLVNGQRSYRRSEEIKHVPVGKGLEETKIIIILSLTSAGTLRCHKQVLVSLTASFLEFTII